MHERANFFISYNKADEDWAEWIAWELEEAGQTIILQAWDFRPSDNFVIKMNDALEECERLIAVLSPDYKHSSFGSQEWAPKLAQDPTGEGGLVIPVRVRQGELPALFRAIIHIDLVDKDEPQAKQALLDGIKKGRVKPAKKPRFPRAKHPGFPGATRPLTEQEPTLTLQPEFRGSFANQLPSPALMRPSWLRSRLDRWFPSLHLLLTRGLRLFSEPPESQVLRAFLDDQTEKIWTEIRERAYVEPLAKSVSEEKARRTGFIEQVIKEILGLSHGGDSHSARISVLSRRSKFVRNMVKRLLSAKEPLVLLGDPGMGKSITLLKAAMLMADRERRRIFPRVCLLVELGGFKIAGDRTTAVWNQIIDSTPVAVRPYLEELAENKRLMILFDGMDEMSRVNYNEYTRALSDFAGNWKDQIKTLFSCRITDFTPSFRHNRLVLMPFTEDLILKYLGAQSIIKFPVEIGHDRLLKSALAKKLSGNELPVQATNPFVLWLVCRYILNKKQWPKSRVELLDHYNRSNYEEKILSVPGAENRTSSVEHAFFVWGAIAFEITNRNMGTELLRLDLEKSLGPNELMRVEEGLRCGVFWQDKIGSVIRFKHHRFQEFFTAYYLRNSKVEVSLRWLDKLDSPRWQETMLNLVLMGGGDKALRVLAGSFERDLSKLAELAKPPAEVPASDGPEPEQSASLVEATKRAEITAIETLLADRVELASRILQQTQLHPNETRSALLSAFKIAVSWLSDHGNPITQVKLLMASRLVPEIDLWEIAGRAIDRKINWVSQQAYIIALDTNQEHNIAKDTGGNSLRRLLDDLSLNFASGEFLNRFNYYRRIATAGQARLKLSLVAGLIIYVATLAVSYGLVRTAQQVVVPAFSLTEAWAQESANKAIDFWEKRVIESHKEKSTNAKTAAAVEQDLKTPRWVRTYLQDSQPRFEVAIASSRQALNSWWFFSAIHAVMLLSLVYSLRTFPEDRGFAFQWGGYLCLLLMISLWTLWFGGAFNTIVLIYFLFVFVGALAAISWLTTFLVQLSGFCLFSVLTRLLARQGFSRESLLTIPLGPFWDNGFRRSASPLKRVVLAAFVPFLLVPISIGVEVDWPRIGQRIERILAGLPSIPLGMKISLNVLAFATICVVVVRLRPIVMRLSSRLRSWIAQRTEKEMPKSVGEAVAGCLTWIVLLLACASIERLSKVNWHYVGEYTLRVVGLFPSIPIWVNISFSLVAYAVVAGGVVSLVVIVINKLKNTRKVLERLVGWTLFWLGVALLVLVLWGISWLMTFIWVTLGVSSIDLNFVWSYVAAAFDLFPYFPPFVNGVLSFAFYLEVIGLLVFLGMVARKTDQGLKYPGRVLGIWTIVSLVIALVPFMLWGLILLLKRLGLGFYSAALTGQLGPMVVGVLLIACVVMMLILLRITLKDTWFDPIYTLGRSADPIDEWKSFDTLNAREQARLIERTSESRRSDEDFLKLLKSVEESVGKEPASSVYWQTRDKMEAIDLQKRMG